MTGCQNASLAAVFTEVSNSHSGCLLAINYSTTSVNWGLSQLTEKKSAFSHILLFDEK